MLLIRVKKFKGYTISLLFCGIFFATLCNSRPLINTATPSIAAIESVNLQLKWFHQFQFAGYYAAKEKGYYSEVGLDVNLIERSPEINVVDQVVSGVAQYGIEDSGIVVSYANGKPIKALAAIFQHNPFIFFSKQSSGIVSPYEMVGKRIMFDRKDGVGAEEVPLRALLDQSGITESQFTHVATSFDKYDLINDKVDVMSGYITDAPYFFEEQGVKINIINPLNYGIDFYGDLLFTSEQELQEYPGRAERFRKASLKGWQYALEHPEEIIQLIKDQYHSKLSLGLLRYEAKQVDKLIIPKLIPLGEIKTNRLKQVANIYTQLKLAPKLTNEQLKDFVNLNPGNLKLTEQDKRWIKTQKNITFTGNPHWLPYEAFNEKGKYIGIVSEYLSRIEKLLGTKFNIIPTQSWSESVNKVKQGKVDIISETVGSELNKVMNFTQHFLSSPIVIIMHKDEPFVNNLTQVAEKK